MVSARMTERRMEAIPVETSGEYNDAVDCMCSTLAACAVTVDIDAVVVLGKAATS